MLSRKVNQRAILAGILMTALGCLVALTIVAEDATHADLRLSKQDMENIVGGGDGEFSCCDGCYPLCDWYEECHHNSSSWPLDADCSRTGCILNDFFTDSCDPSTGEDADGCDTQLITPETYSLWQDFWMTDTTCNWTGDKGWDVKKKMYYGCDTSEDYECDVIPVWWACKGGTCTHPEEVSFSNTQGQEFECGCD